MGVFPAKVYHIKNNLTTLSSIRHHSVEVAHIAKAYQFPTAGDDAAKAFIVRLEEIPWEELAFDHPQVLQDYLEWRKGEFEKMLLN